ncbi:hypothetical protein ABZ752_15245 [Streptomyces roseifaciens]
MTYDSKVQPCFREAPTWPRPPPPADPTAATSTPPPQPSATGPRANSARGWSYKRIAAELGIDVHTVHDGVQRALRAIVQEPAAEVRALELERLDQELEHLDKLYAIVERVLERHHITVSNGKIIYLHDALVEDPGPVLQAVDRLVRIEDARRRNAERSSSASTPRPGSTPPSTRSPSRTWPCRRW